MERLVYSQETNRKHGHDLDLLPQTHSKLRYVVKRQRQGSDIEDDIDRCRRPPREIRVEAGSRVLTVPGLPRSTDRVALEDEDDAERQGVADVECYQDVYDDADRPLGKHAQVEQQDGDLDECQAPGIENLLEIE